MSPASEALLRRVLRETAESDAAVLRMRDVDHLPYGRMGIRLGVSRMRAWQKVQEARRRQAKREELGLEGWMELDAFFARIEP